MIRAQTYIPPVPERPGDDLINRKELASRLKCSARTIDRWQRNCRLPCSKPSGAVLFSWSAVLDWLSNVRGKPGQRRRRRRTTNKGRKTGICRRRQGRKTEPEKG